MRDLGVWPCSQYKGVVHRFHCIECNEYESISVPQMKLKFTADGAVIVED